MRIIILILGLTISATAQNIYVQWTTDPAKGFVAVKDWSKLPKLPDPSGKADIYHASDKLGWVAAMKIGNHLVAGCDHYAIVKANNQVTSYCIRDDRRFYMISAEVCTHQPSLDCKYYGTWHPTETGKGYLDLPWEQFVYPPDTLIRHGLYIGNRLWDDHKAFWK